MLSVLRQTIHYPIRLAQ